MNTKELEAVISEMQIIKRLPDIPPLVVDLVELDGNNIYQKVEPTVLITKRAGYQRKSYGKYKGYNDLTIAARIELGRVHRIH